MIAVRKVKQFRPGRAAEPDTSPVALRRGMLPADYAEKYVAWVYVYDYLMVHVFGPQGQYGFNRRRG